MRINLSSSSSLSLQVNWSPDAKLYVTASKDGDLKIWDGVSNRCVNTFQKAHDSNEVCSAVFSRNGKVRAQKLSSGSMILLTITLDLRMISQNIWRRIVENVLVNISLSYDSNRCINTFQKAHDSNEVCSAVFSKNGKVRAQKLSSGSMILLTITLELRMISQNIWRRIVDNVLVNISLPNIFQTFAWKVSAECFWQKLWNWEWFRKIFDGELLTEKYHQSGCVIYGCYRLNTVMLCQFLHLWINALGRQLPLKYSLIFVHRFWMTSYHVSVLYDSTIGIEFPNNGGQFHKCVLQACTNYTLIDLLQYYLKQYSVCCTQYKEVI